MGIFDSKQVAPSELNAITQVKAEADTLYAVISMNVPDGRMKSLAITKLEEAVMWATKGISTLNREGLEMSEVFFIGDTHFGHKGVLKYEQEWRPFATIEEHDAELVRRWNSVVGKRDTVWHLGDFAFGKRNIEIAAELNGNKKLVLGNHDMYDMGDYLKYFSKVYGVVEYKGFILSHVPVHPLQLSKRFWCNVHGHLHDITYTDARYVNVSCEQVNLTPIPWDEVLNRATDWENLDPKALREEL